MHDWKLLLIPYEQAVEELKIKFKSIRNEYRILDEYSPIEFVTGRVKKISSIIDKARLRNIPLNNIEEEIEDIAGIRIMCQFVEDIDKVVSLIRERDGKDLKIAFEKDYIKDIKESGYRSHHIIIKYSVYTAFGEKEILAEIQIRTLAMNFWATIEHSLKYKFEGNIPETIKKRLELAAEAAYKLDNEMSEIRDEIMDAQEIFQAKAAIVEEILKNLQLLYFSGKVTEIEELRKKFFSLQQKGNYNDLKNYNIKLRKLLQKHKIYEIL